MKKLITFIAIVFLMLNYSCKKDEESKPQQPDISVVDVSQTTDWDYWVAGKKDYYFIQTENSKPSVVEFHSYDANKDISIFFSADGLPQKLVVSNYIYLFDNFNGNKVDIGVVYPNGDIEILREVESDADWDIYKNAVTIDDWSDLVRWTGRVVSGVPCALGVGATVATGGVGWPLAAFTCGNYLLGLSSDIAQNEFDVHNGFTEFVDQYGTVSTYYGCTTDFGVSCLTDLSSNALGDIADHLQELENKAEDVNTTEAALYAGSGDVQITLTWNNEADIDLHVFDPDNNEIYWMNPGSPSGGVLDYDDIDGYGPENIYWPKDEAPSGIYSVLIHHYPWEEKPQSAGFTVLINAFGHVEKFTGSISYDQTISIAEFSENGIFPTAKNTMIISKATK
ncbi:MAG: hypothetical protein K9H16_00910 [Bacteroidales bacterium]|nr:hypothetical protein [Bacteroidales bacterium]